MIAMEDKEEGGEGVVEEDARRQKVEKEKKMVRSKARRGKDSIGALTMEDDEDNEGKGGDGGCCKEDAPRRGRHTVADKARGVYAT